MKNFFAAAVAVGLSSASAFAADMPSRPVVKAPIAAVYDWTGFYFGVNAGIGLGRNLTGHATPLGAFTESATSYLGSLGAVGGAQLGYNWQRGNWVFGVETDIQVAGMRDQTCVYFCAAGSFLRLDQKLDWFGTARGRIGLATGPVLSYFTGGFAYGGVKTEMSTNLGGLAAASINETRTGWTIGSGVEAVLGGNWTGKIEYLYLDLGTQSGTYAGGPVTHALNSDIREHIFRVGANYRIGGTGAYAATPVANWTGFYIGANVGTGTARNRTTVSLGVLPAPPTINDAFNLSPHGYLGGVQIGYNWQVANWVVGLEADIQGSTQKDDKSCQLQCVTTPVTQFLALDQRLPWFGTVRGRIGYSLGSTLFYGTGGLAYGEVKNRVTEGFINVPLLNTDLKHIKAGYAVGAGIETPFELFGLFGKNWTSKTEYLYVDLGKTTDSYVYSGFNHTIDSKVQEHIFRTGLNYHFNTPMVAKY